MYLQEGMLEFFKEIDQLREETGELKLGKAIARIMKGENLIANGLTGCLSLEK